jgi:hypothetical protein
VSGDFTGVSSVVAMDLDIDGDQDILAAGGDGVYWFENTSGDATVWTERQVDDQPASDAIVVDVDRDDDHDLVSAAPAQSLVSWWKNETIHSDIRIGPSNTVIEPTIRVEMSAITAGDIDGDGDTDVLASSRSYVDWLKWFENTGSSWVEHDLGTSYANFFGLELADMDHDGDLDIVGICTTGGTPGDPGEVILWENLNGLGTSWQEHVLPKDRDADTRGYYDGLQSLALADMNNDGLLDIVVGSDTFVHWFERWTWTDVGGETREWKAHMIAPDIDDWGNYGLDQIPAARSRHPQTLCRFLRIG